MNRPTPTVGYGLTGMWQGLDVDALVRDVAEGICPACRQGLVREPLLTYNHRHVQDWGCCRCCARAWRLEETSVKATCCVEHANWDCTHPLPGGTWTPAAHAAAWPAVRRLVAGPATLHLHGAR
jgi:hypothetical protein